VAEFLSVFPTINPSLANLLFLIKYIERWGTGTNDIIKWCRKEGLPELIFKEITNREYQNLCPDVNRETLRKDLNDLINKKAIIRKGEKKGIYYEFI